MECQKFMSNTYFRPQKILIKTYVPILYKNDELLASEQGQSYMTNVDFCYANYY